MGVHGALASGIPGLKSETWGTLRVFPLALVGKENSHTGLSPYPSSTEALLLFRRAGPNRLTKLYTFSKARLDVLPLCVRLLSADLRIPIRRRIGEELTLPAEVAHRFFIDFDAQARPRRNGDETLNHKVPFVG
jgi:hypothetical protein